MGLPSAVKNKPRFSALHACSRCGSMLSSESPSFPLGCSLWCAGFNGQYVAEAEVCAATSLCSKDSAVAAWAGVALAPLVTPHPCNVPASEFTCHCRSESPPASKSGFPPAIVEWKYVSAKVQMLLVKNASQDCALVGKSAASFTLVDDSFWWLQGVNVMTLVLLPSS